MITESRVAIYARVSTEEQAEHGYSIDAQIDTIRNYCRMQQKIVVEEYVDRGISGKSIDGRYELQRLLRDAANDKFDEVVVWKISRLARKTIDLLKIVDVLNQNNISFRSFSENFETETPMGKFALQMMGAVGELERNTIVDNVKLGMKQRARTGSWNGGIVLGYKSEPVVKGNRQTQETILTIVPEEAVIVRKIFELYASGKGLKSIANQINHEGYKTKRNNSFSTNAIKEIILNPVYVGKIRFNQYENWNDQRRKGKTDEPIIAEGEHEPIIDLALWEKVQHLQQNKSKYPARKFDGQFILTGLIKCPKCGASMVASRTINKLKDGTKIVRRYYSCGNFRSKGSAVCNANSIKAEYIEDYVFVRLKEVVKDTSILKDLIEKVNKLKKERIKPMKDEFVTIHKTIENTENRRKKYFEMYEKELIDPELLSNRLNELSTDLDRLKKRKSELDYHLGGEGSNPLSLKYVKNIINRFSNLLDKVQIEQKKTLLHLVINKIEINEQRKVKNIELHFNQKTQLHFLELAPSKHKSDGAFAFSSKQKSEIEPISLFI